MAAPRTGSMPKAMSGVPSAPRPEKPPLARPINMTAGMANSRKWRSSGTAAAISSGDLCQLEPRSQQVDDRERDQIDRAGDVEDQAVGPDPLQHLADIEREDHAADRSGGAAD